MQYLHKRRIETDCWLLEDGTMKVVGELDDDKGIPFQAYSKHIPSGGDLHTLRVTLLVSSELIIQEAKIEMIDVPGEYCMEIEPMAERLIGLAVAKGYVRAINERLGGVKSCNHIVSLLQSMGPAIIQAYYSIQGLKNVENGGWLQLMNMCHVFREEGPLIARLRQEQGDPAAKIE